MDFQLQEKRIFIKNKQGEKLVGLVSVPNDETKKYPAVVLVHGFGVEKRENGLFDKFAESLNEAGFLTFRFDFSGCGESEGNYRKTSLSKLKNELAEILKYVKAQSFVNASCVGILAQSFGTAITVALVPDIKCLVMMGSLAHPKERFVELFGKEYNPIGVSTRERSGGNTTEIDSQFWPEFEKYDLLELIKQIKGSILFIHGSKDDKVPLSEMESYFEEANEPKKKIIIEGADHELRPHQEKASKKAAEWFSEYLL